MPLHPATETFPCPSCGNPFSRVIDSRFRLGRLHRRRKCLSCDARYSTREMPVVVLDGVAEAIVAALAELE